MKTLLYFFSVAFACIRMHLLIASRHRFSIAMLGAMVLALEAQAAEVQHLTTQTATASGAGASGTPSIASFNIPAGKNRVLFIWAGFERDHISSADVSAGYGVSGNTAGTGLGDNYPDARIGTPPATTSNNQITARVVGASGTVDKKNALVIGGTPSGDTRFLNISTAPSGSPAGTAFFSVGSFHIVLFENEIKTLLGSAASGTVAITLPDVVTPSNAGDDAFIVASVFQNVEQTATAVVRNATATAQVVAGTAGNASLAPAAYDAGQAPDEAADGKLILGASSSTEGFVLPAGHVALATVSTTNTNGQYDTPNGNIHNEPNGVTAGAYFRNGDTTPSSLYTLQMAGAAATLIYGGTNASFLLESDNADTSDAPTSYGDATHAISGIRLGASVDADSGSLNNATATGDDVNNTDDENGVTIPASLWRGLTQTISVSIQNGSGRLNGWIDWNADGDFNDAGEQIANDQAVTAGTVNLSVGVPSGAVIGQSVARFRVSNNAGECNTPASATASGEVEDYAVTIAAPSSDATLSALSLSAGTVTPAFSSDTSSYTASVPNATSSITVTATRAEANATLAVQVNGGGYSALTSGSPSSALALVVGSNTVNVRVTAQDGTTTTTYTTTITRRSSVATLSNLTTSTGTFTPTFASGTTSYAMLVPNSTTSLAVTPTVTQTNATVTVNTALVSSGSASGLISLNVGSNSITVTVTAEDTSFTTNYELTVTRAAPSPTLSNVSPASGSTAGGTSVTITGTNLTGATGVTFGGVAATSVAVVNSTTITAVTPAGTAGTASVVVTTAGGSNAANTLFTYVAPPAVTSISPASGRTAGGTNVTITGTDLTGATGVTIGGAAATNVSVVNATTITCTTPAGTAGTASVVVTTAGGSNAANTLFTYVAPPAVTSISPTSGSTAGGTNVTITGAGFTGATGVTIGGAAATNVSVVNATTITAVTPAGTAGTASVVVTTAGGSNAANTLFTYVAPPAVTSISPASGRTAGGTNVTITGTDLTGATGVTIGGAAATSVTVVNSTTITAVTPAGTAGTASVVVTTAGGSNAANTLFTYANMAPTLADIGKSGFEDTTVTFTAADFTSVFTDPESDSLASITVATLPATGLLKLSGSDVTASQVILLADLGDLTYVPADHENGAKTFTVTASDGTSSSAAATVTMTLTEVNDTPTDIALSASSIAENNAANATVGTLSTTDVDTGDTFTYTLVSGTGGTDNATFSISGDALQLTPSADYETKSTYAVRVRTTDAGGLFYEEAFTISISDVAENPSSISATGGSGTAITSPQLTARMVFADNGSTANLAEADALLAGSNVLRQFTGPIAKVDFADSNTNGAFAGVLPFPGEASIDSIDSFALQVTGSIHVPTSGQWTFGVRSDDGSRIRIDGVTQLEDDTQHGEEERYVTVTLTAGMHSLDFVFFENGGGAQVELFSAPGAHSSFNGDFTLITSTPISIAEDVPANSLVTTFTAQDEDAGSTATFALVTGTGDDDNASFTLSSGGELTINNSPDYEVKKLYSIRVRATDGTGLTLDRVFHINVVGKFIQWGDAGSLPADSLMDASLATAGATYPLLFGGMGQGLFDVRLEAGGMAASGLKLIAGQPCWSLTGASGGALTEVSFRFYKPGSTTEFTYLKNVIFRFEDAEQAEQFSAFSYWDGSGTKVSVPWNDSSVFTYSHTPTFTNSNTMVENGATQATQTQAGKWIQVNLSGRQVTGIEFSHRKRASSAGSVVMTHLAGELAPGALDFGGVFSPLQVGADPGTQAEVPDYRSQATWSGGAPATVVQTPAPGTLLSLGLHDVSLTLDLGSGVVARQGFDITVGESASVNATPTVTAVTATGASLGGTVSSLGSGGVLERGVVYAAFATNADPLLGGTGVTSVIRGGGRGGFTNPVSGLSAATTYAFKAYVTTPFGTIYSDVRFFTTDTGLTFSTGIASLTNRLVRPGESQGFTFSLVESTSAIFSGSGATAGLQWTLFNQVGTAVRSGSGDINFSRALASGSYRLVVTNPGTTSETFSLNLDTAFPAEPQPDISVGPDATASSGIDVHGPASALQSAVIVSRRGVPKTVFFLIDNDGTLADSMRIAGPGPDSRFRITYTLSGVNVTAGVIAGVALTPVIDTNDAPVPLFARVAPDRSNPQIMDRTIVNGRRTIVWGRRTFGPRYVTVTASTDPDFTDTATFEVNTTP